MRLGAGDRRIAAARVKREADVVVVVFGFSRAGGNAMYVDVVDRRARERDVREARFLGRLTQRDAADIRIAVGMPAELEPRIELTVVGQQRGRPGAIDDPGRTRHVADREHAFEARGLRADEGAQTLCHRRFTRVAGNVRRELAQQRRAAVAWINAQRARDRARSPARSSSPTS